MYLLVLSLFYDVRSKEFSQWVTALSPYIHTVNRLKSHHCLWIVTQILALHLLIKRTTTPLICHLPLPAGRTTLQYHSMKRNPFE